MRRLFLLLAGSALLSACAATDAVCPVDTTHDFDVRITQVNRPVLWSVPISDADGRLSPSGGPGVDVRYAVLITNRMSTPVRLTQISLEEPHVIGHRATVACLGLETFGATMIETTRGYDTVIPAGGEVRVVIPVKEYPQDPSVFTLPTLAMTAHMRVEAAGRVRSERLTRRVVTLDPAKGAESQDALMTGPTE